MIVFFSKEGNFCTGDSLVKSLDNAQVIRECCLISSFRDEYTFFRKFKLNCL